MPYWQLPFYRKEIGAAHPEALAAFDETLAGGDLMAALKAIPDEVVDHFAGIGNAETVRGKVDEYREAGVTLPLIGSLPSHDGSKGVEAVLEAAS
jgi:alkanesulfonate monooxygenase SsuD/methylene tetrahydromethanopterin reductase-like flavin-dependent oxidoreductase (luciferase family)